MKIIQKITAPLESINDQYLTVKDICFSSGDYVKKGETILELESSKTTLSIIADVDGFITFYCKVDDEVKINSLIAQITDIQEFSSLNKDASKEILSNSVINYGENETSNIIFESIFSSSALEIISREKIEKSVFREIDFVTEKIVLNYLDQDSNIKTKDKIVVDNNYSDTLNKNIFGNSNVTFEKISNSKKREIEYLNSVQPNSLISTIYMDIDLGSFFKSVNNELKYFKNSMLPVIIYESSRLLLKYPILNSYFVDNKIALYSDINIGIAMDIDDGLKVVKLEATNNMTINDIENSLILLSNKYHDKALNIFDLTNISFTISDLSANGAYFFTPLINKNNCAILGISKVDTKLNRVIVSLTFDHRLTEGKVATQFLNELKDRIESYSIQNSELDEKNIYCYKCMKKLKDDLGGIGFINIVNSLGQNKFICDTCLFYH